ncbi:MAG: hypothetical protein CSA23_03290 [Deltaproteobacteria bacterium]|nr:MAG: hypothetical protein CSA23_03290 [Deltaproteobacteria bacterium]
MTTLKKGFSILFVILLSTPVVFWLIVHARSNDDNTVRHGFPAPEAHLLLERDYYQAVDGWFNASLPLADALTCLNNWLNYHIFGKASTRSVHVGIHGWLYPGPHDTGPMEPSEASQAGQQLFLKLHALENMITATGRRFVVGLVPGKAEIYPEHMGTQVAFPTLPMVEALLDAQTHYPLNGFLALRPVLKKAKLNGTMVYTRRSRLWECAGAAVAADQLLTRQELTQTRTASLPAEICPPADDDLYRLLIGRENIPVRADTAGCTSGPHAVNGPTAILYGDDNSNRLLPHITHAFNAISLIHIREAPVLDRNVLNLQSDMFLLVVGEAHLDTLHINLESIYDVVGQRLQGVATRTIPLAQSLPRVQTALEYGSDGLRIRSGGVPAFFSLPAVDGSAADAFRMVRLTFSESHQDRVRVKTARQSAPAMEKTLGRDSRIVLVPLPFQKSVSLWINPGHHPGVFTLEKADLISFYGKQVPVAPTPATTPPDDIYSGIQIEPLEPSGPPAALAPIEAPPGHPVEALPELTLADLPPGRIIQRQGKSADVVVTGTYTGAAGPVEARVVQGMQETVIVPWTVVDDAPENGLFTGILKHVPQGGWYRLQIRSGIAPWVLEKGTNPWGVGMLIACIGQSNMREWFYTGKAHRPSPQVRLHRDGQWQIPDRSGNGALALGNRLATSLKIPVGLLDYAVNGSGLTAKADWGKGFWRDTGPESIYSRFIDGVLQAGGVVEYVVWMQGEADAAKGSVSREEYRAALEGLVDDQLRMDIHNGSGRSRLPFLMIPLVRRPTGRDLTCQWIRDAQMDVLTSIEECHLAGLSIDLENHGRQHLAPSAYTVLGDRTAGTILYLLDKAPYHRGPSVAAVTRVSDRIVDIGLAHRGGTDFTPWTQISGFEVLSGKTRLVIDTVTRTNGNTIRIRLTEPPPRHFSVRYLYGAHPDTTHAVHDNTSRRLPLEPFVQYLK